MESCILALPLLLLLLLLIVIVLACFKKWWWSGGLFVFCLALNWYGEVFALHPLGCLGNSDDKSDIKLLTFNINASGENFEDRMNGIVELIERETPDVLFLSEMYTPYNHYDNQLDSILNNSFPYSSYKKKSEWGNVFYSKYPIDSVEIVGITVGKSQPLVTIDVKDRTIAVLGCHLSSNNYVDSKTKIEVDSVSNKADVKQYFKTIEKGYQLRKQDVDSICSYLACLDKTHLIVIGDMNDVGGSYSIRTLKSLGLHDAWWKGGFGLGGTRKVLGFPFRIDHILYGSGFDLKNVKRLQSDGISDHDAIVANFDINKI